MSRQSRFYLLIIFFSLLLPLQVSAKSVEDFDISDNAEMDRRYDWTITIKANAKGNVLDYPTSGLRPLAKLAISYRVTPRLNNGQDKTLPYEDLWYHESRAIGCRRYNPLTIPEDYQGAIRITPSDDAAKSPGALANAITRLLLDIGLQKNVLTVVFIPRDIFNSVRERLGIFGFYPSPIRGSIPLFLFSDPASTRINLYYRPGSGGTPDD